MRSVGGDTRKGVHILYGCEMVHNFWTSVVQFINNVMKTELSEGPVLCILGILPRRTGLSQQTCIMDEISPLTGSGVVLRDRKSKEMKCFKEWRHEVTKIASFEKLIHKANNSLHVFLKI